MTTSALTSRDIAARAVARRWPALPEQLHPRAFHNAGLLITGALERLARGVREGDDRDLLVKEISHSAAAGVIDLTHADFAGVFVETLRRPGSITTASEAAVSFKHVSSLDRLRATVTSDSSVVWYNLTGKRLTFKSTSAGPLNGYAADLRLRASYVPTLDDAGRPLPHELEDRLIDLVGELVAGLGGADFLKLGKAKAAAAAKEGA